MGILPVKQHNGAGMAQSIADIVHQNEIDVSQIVSAGFEGQYFTLGVPEELQKLGFNCTYKWDDAHLLQLAENDWRCGHVRGHQVQKVDWVQRSFSMIANVISEVNFGKSFETLLAIAEQTNCNLTSLKTYSSTRFAPYVHRALIAVWDDYDAILLTLKSIANGDISDKKKKDRCDSLSKEMASLKFLGSLLCLIDVYKVIGHCSLQLQQVKQLPYERTDALKAAVTKLQLMESIEFTNSSTMEHWPYLRLFRVHAAQKRIFSHPMTEGRGTGDNCILTFMESRAKDLLSTAVDAITIRFNLNSVESNWCGAFIRQLDKLKGNIDMEDEPETLTTALNASLNASLDSGHPFSRERPNFTCSQSTCFASYEVLHILY